MSDDDKASGDDALARFIGEFWIGLQGDKVVFMRPLPSRLDPDSAVVVAAKIVALLPLEQQARFPMILERLMKGEI